MRRGLDELLALIAYGSKVVAGPGIGVQVPVATLTRQLGSFAASDPV